MIKASKGGFYSLRSVGAQFSIREFKEFKEFKEFRDRLPKFSNLPKFPNLSKFSIKKTIG